MTSSRAALRAKPPARSRVGLSLAILAALLACGCSPSSDSPSERDSGPPEGRGSGADASPEASLSSNGTNVLLVILDTVRADRLSCYGYDRPVTPNLDRLARRGVRFTRFFSNSSWTLPAHASLFTGTYAVAHQATQETLVLGDELPTLAEIFRRAGHQTFASSSNAVVSPANGLARGFDRFEEVYRRDVAARYPRDGRHANNMAFADFLRESDPERPFFAFLNYIEAHLPYTPPEPFLSKLVDGGFSSARVQEAMRLRMRHHYGQPPGLSAEQFAILSQLYDAEVAHLDAQIAHLLGVLQDDGRLANTVVIITSDHGENIGDHGHFAHVFGIQNTLLHVPLIVLFPDGARGGEVRTDVTQLLDLFPTLLAACAIDYAGRFDGQDLFASGTASSARSTMAEYYYPRQVLSVFKTDELELHRESFVPYMRRLRSLQDGRFKLAWSSDGRHELYRTDTDPLERLDLLKAEPDHPEKERMLAELARRVEAHQGPVPLKPPPPVGWMMPGFEESIVDPEHLERLRALGYID